MFSDLETDYINPIDFCNKMNKVRLGFRGTPRRRDTTDCGAT